MMAPRHLPRAICLFVSALAFGCAATLGTPNPDLLERMATEGAFGPQQRIRLCALLDAGVSESAASGLVEEAWNRTEARALGLSVNLVPMAPWRREGNDIESIFRGVRRIPIAPECDRLIAFLGHSDERASQLAGGVSLVHGFVLASAESMRHYLMTPKEALRHELYHLVGCGHARVMDECYRRIARAKARRNGPDAFFPVFLYLEDEDIARNCGENALIDDRAEANRIARLWVSQNVQLTDGRPQPGRPCPAQTREM